MLLLRSKSIVKRINKRGALLNNRYNRVSKHRINVYNNYIKEMFSIFESVIIENKPHKLIRNNKSNKLLLFH